MPLGEAFYQDLVDNLYDGVYFVDRDRTITYWNKGAERITGYAADHVLGRGCRDNLLCHVTANGTQLCLSQCPLAASMEDGRPREAEVFLHHADGHRVPVWVRASPLRDDTGAICGAVETFSNNVKLQSARHELQRLERQNQTDALTEVGNRAHADRRLRGLIAEADHAPAAGGVLFIDIDRFKAVNDTYGHDAGDRVLRMVAATLKNNVRAVDDVSRWGGEEFLIILYDINTAAQLRAVAEKLRHLVATSSLEAGADTLTVTISIGATLLQPADDPASLVRRVDALLYQSKQAGRDRVTLDST